MKTFYQSLLYSWMPSPLHRSVSRIETLYEGQQFMSTGVLTQSDIDNLKSRNDFYCLDIEIYKTPVLLNDLSIQLRTNHNLFGFYGVPYLGYYNVVTNNTINLSNDRLINETYLTTIANSAALFPSLYMYIYSPLSEWTSVAIATIDEAKRLRDLAGVNIPILPFIWPQYHDDQNTTGNYIADNIWNSILHTVTDNADGFTLWGGFNVFGGNPIGQYQWDNSASWWMQTLSFLNSMSFNGNSRSNFSWKRRLS